MSKLPWWLRGCMQCGRPWFDPCVGKIPWRRKWQPTPVSLPGKFHGQRSLAGYSPWGHKESDTIEWLHFHFSLSRSKRQLNMCICFHWYVCTEVYAYILWLKFVSKLWEAEAQREVKQLPWGYTASKGSLYDLPQGRFTAKLCLSLFILLTVKCWRKAWFKMGAWELPCGSNSWVS